MKSWIIQVLLVGLVTNLLVFALNADIEPDLRWKSLYGLVSINLVSVLHVWLVSWVLKWPYRFEVIDGLLTIEVPGKAIALFIADLSSAIVWAVLAIALFSLIG